MTNATIRDVAAQARVSIKTVSRVINNVKTVKPHTRERVLRVIRKLDYHPSPSARGLGGSRSYLIGLLDRGTGGRDRELSGCELPGGDGALQLQVIVADG
jgi:Bacterial regulatory proteins, lacI family